MKRPLLIAISALVLVALLRPDGSEAAMTISRVYINGVPTQVYFSDGDSFRQLGGRWNGRNSRLAGFNTLESFGAAHQWGNWHPYELWVVAKEATLNARRGVWHCEGDGSVDTYGRVLLDCPDLAVSQIRHGFAHAMNVDDTPARPEYLRAQAEAIAARRGIWAHGVPSYVLTSVHSAAENPTRTTQYNRMISTRDGHSESWQHTDSYPECSWQCATETFVEEDALSALALQMRRDPSVAPGIGEISNLLLKEAIERFIRRHELPAYTSEEVSQALLPALERLSAEGALPEAQERRGACMIFAEFLRRYGRNRAWCFHDHGTAPPHMEGQWEQ